MRKHASNFEGTAYLATENKEYEHREKYSMGDGYYLGKSKYSGWTISKEHIYDREKFIERFAFVAGDEANICVKVQTATNDNSQNGCRRFCDNGLLRKGDSSFRRYKADYFELSILLIPNLSMKI
jgi:hypothetical protein